MPIDHTSLPVQNFEVSKAFYTEILKPLSYGIFMEFPGHALGYAPEGGRSDCMYMSITCSVASPKTFSSR